MNRASTASTQPPKYPLTRPTETPGDGGDERGDDANEQRDPRAVQDADEQVAAEFVGAEKEAVGAGRDRRPVPESPVFGNTWPARGR